MSRFSIIKSENKSLLMFDSPGPPFIINNGDSDEFELIEGILITGIDINLELCIFRFSLTNRVPKNAL